MGQKHTNRLIHETSPYLLQHAHNPVDWYPWGEEALKKAKEENKPILLSIGYSACHWCHVMEHESFENEEIAALMNQHFINIKVDREERPDLDQIYQNAVQLFIRRGGGWPLTMFLTPDQEPFYGGTYFPPVDRYNIPGFPRVLLSVTEAYHQRSDEIRTTSKQVTTALKQFSTYRISQQPMERRMIEDAVRQLGNLYDPVHGGLGRSPKFPSTMALSLFLRHYRGSKDSESLNHVVHTLKKMASGGIYDQLGGGFHRYSVDDEWLVPHFEKMLYDNAQLVKLYLEAYQVTPEPLFKRVVEETLGYVLREMTHPEGGFYSTQDADSEGEEGKFFVWDYDEVIKHLGQEMGPIFCRAYDVTVHGNFERKNILHINLPVEAVAVEAGRDPREVAKLLEEARQRLFSLREQRVKPHRDEKILTSWNALMLSALIEAYRVLGLPQYLQGALKSLTFLKSRLYSNGRLLRTYKDSQGKLNAYLDDYSFLIVALLDLYETTFDPSTLQFAKELAGILEEQFFDEANGGFFFTGRDHESLITRPKPGYDHSIPSGNAMAAQALLRLYYYTGQEGYLAAAEKTLRSFYESMQENPFGFSSLLAVLDFYLEKPKEVIIVSSQEKRGAEEFLRRIGALYLPNRTLCWVDHDRVSRGPEGIPPIAQGKETLEGQTTVYVCHNFTCSPPVTTWEALEPLLLS